MEIITKAKNSCTAYEKPGSRKPKKEAAVRLKELFTTHKEQFQDAESELYGKKESIRYCCIDLLRAEALSGTAFCTGGNGWHPEHPGKHQPGTGATVGQPAL
ncbi:hypothetical protein [Bacteroides congonensis]|uniref:hypothetical protein n=1 Tax=Bacteroides congonensis TaxID=1871006 RepID=UPI00321BCD10